MTEIKVIFKSPLTVKLRIEASGFYQYKWIRSPAYMRGPASIRGPACIITCQVCVITRHSLVRAKGDVLVLLYVFFVRSNFSKSDNPRAD